MQNQLTTLTLSTMLTSFPEVFLCWVTWCQTQTSFFMQKQILISVDSSGLNYVYTSVCVFAYVNTEALRRQRRASDPLELQLQAIGHGCWELNLDSLHEQPVPSCGAISPH